MHDLIAIDYKNDTPTVNGRELHKALEIGTEYAKWFSRMTEYGFKEGKDYSSFLTVRSDGLPGKPKTDHSLTISMAKEICMIQRNEIGKKFREHFIAIEEAWNSPEKIMERALQIAQQKAIEAERKIFALVEENETLEIALNSSLKFYTVAKYNRTFNMGWNLKQCQRIGKRLSAYCRSRAIEIRTCETNDERFGTVNSYPITAWEDFLEVTQCVV
ncbi:antA/AntB antirepressor family protein [Desulfoscipio gibsoniae]|jgi:anti-repressor protein|uniref:Phage anti-repressor protein n=1 Tax=Desulfoscipio gibsoniae DSM 7213 TaxID=767817 RepID=R4KT33_9FIRM|nr:antA/AntB antirepressor family protein [Desulfoscipio gibsoniae]AGL03755.1 phage anti-repressor protein [Desulfoscipio gibsoniae DSM 7213]